MDYKIIRNSDNNNDIFSYPFNKENPIFKLSLADIPVGDFSLKSSLDFKKLFILLSGKVIIDSSHENYNINQFDHIFTSKNSTTLINALENSKSFLFEFDDSIELLKFDIIYKNFDCCNEEKGINIFYNISEQKHIFVNNNEYTLSPGDTLVACGNNFNIEGDGVGIFLSLFLK